MTTAASTIQNLQNRQRELLSERENLLLRIAKLESDNEWLRQDRSEVLRIIGRSFRKNASHSFCKHLLTKVEQTLSDTRRAA